MANKDTAGPSGPLSSSPSGLATVSFASGWDTIAASVDVIDYRIIGDVQTPHDFENHNYIRCFFERNTIEGLKKLHIDFKDCTFSQVIFISGKIESSAFVNCVFDHAIFDREIFHNCTFQDCRFHECTFLETDIGNAFIKGCRISGGRFEACGTDNHVFEECLFAGVRFVNCELQIGTILKNYGITRTLFDGCRIRDRRVEEGGRFLSEQALDHFEAPENDVIGQLRLEYFRGEKFVEGNSALDKCLSDNSWLVGLHNDFTAGDRVSQLAEFLIYLWERDEIACQTLLLAHGMTSDLVESLRSMPDEQEYYRILLSVMGSHMLLARKVERFLLVLQNIQETIGAEPYVLIVNGPAEVNFYKEFLPELFKSSDVKIIAARPHNSPSELFLLGTTALAWFLASLERFRLEAYAMSVTRAPDEAAAAQNTTLEEKHNDARGTVAISYKKGAALEIRARALLPFSSVLLDFDLAVSTKIIGKFRNLVINLIQSSESESGTKND